MKKGLVGSLTALLASTGLAMAQQPASLPATRSAMVAPAAETGQVDSAPPESVVIDPGEASVGEHMPWSAQGCCGGGGNPGGRFWWIRFDYLLWWTKQSQFPPLVTNGPTGVIGDPTTHILLSGSDLDAPMRSGGRITLGGYVTDYKAFGVEANYFILENRTESFTAAGPLGNVSRPVFNQLTGTEAAKPVTFLSIGNVNTVCDPGRLQGGEINAISNLCMTPTSRVDLLIGYRYMSLSDRFQMSESSPNNFGGASAEIIDRFDTNNNFNGGQLGLRGEWYCDRWSASVYGKVAVGDSSQTVSNNGVTTLFQPGLAPVVLPGGLYALPSNIGTFRSDKFALIPEAGATFGFQLLDCLRLTVGYSFLYWSSVVRSADQINRVVNLNEIPAVAGPNAAAGTIAHQAVSIKCNDYWAHGLNVGLEWRY
jgi:Putative beta barrel porin-7 (BBP7)